MDDFATQSPSRRPFLMVSGLAVLVLAAVAGRVVAQAQGTGARATPAFEVASVKVNHDAPPFRIGVSFLPGGRVRAEHAPFSMLLQVAFDSHQIDASHSTGDVWKSLFDIDAQAGTAALPATASATAREAQLSAMLRTLLVDRFKLTYHTERREVSLYALVVAAGGSKLTPSPRDRTCAPEQERCGRLPGGPASGMSGIDVDMGRLAGDLTTWLDREVIDRTGIIGRFDISLPPWSRSTLVSAPAGNGREPAEDPSNPSIFAVVRDNLGLRLDPVRESRDVYVIDRVEMPAAN